jgi:hypothetical protein
VRTKYADIVYFKGILNHLFYVGSRDAQWKGNYHFDYTAKVYLAKRLSGTETSMYARLYWR